MAWWHHLSLPEHVFLVPGRLCSWLVHLPLVVLRVLTHGVRDHCVHVHPSWTRFQFKKCLTVDTANLRAGRQRHPMCATCGLGAMFLLVHQLASLFFSRSIVSTSMRLTSSITSFDGQAVGRSLVVWADREFVGCAQSKSDESLQSVDFGISLGGEFASYIKISWRLFSEVMTFLCQLVGALLILLGC